MGILQAAYKTYEVYEQKAGLKESGMEVLTPVSHMLQKAEIEVTITQNGNFISACEIDKADVLTVIPVTVDSASRSGKFPPPHPLCDKLTYLYPFSDGKPYDSYMGQLSQWVHSEYTHPKVSAVYTYLQSKTIFAELLAAGLVTDKKYDRFVR